MRRRPNNTGRRRNIDSASLERDFVEQQLRRYQGPLYTLSFKGVVYLPTFGRIDQARYIAQHIKSSIFPVDVSVSYDNVFNRQFADLPSEYVDVKVVSKFQSLSPGLTLDQVNWIATSSFILVRYTMNDLGEDEWPLRKEERVFDPVTERVMDTLLPVDKPVYKVNENCFLFDGLIIAAIPETDISFVVNFDDFLLDFSPDKLIYNQLRKELKKLNLDINV